MKLEAVAKNDCCNILICQKLMFWSAIKRLVWLNGRFFGISKHEQRLVFTFGLLVTNSHFAAGPR
jgi:hypothetical protein